MIYYLTGTGNSRWAAQLLADHLHDTAEDAAPALKSGLAPSLHSEKPWVFVCPTYGWQIPHVFADLLCRTGFDGSRKAYFVLTCGDDIGAAGPRLCKLCGELGLEYRGVWPLVMPENYVAMFPVPGEEEAKKIIDAAREPLLEAAALIAGDQPFLHHPGLQWLWPLRQNMLHQLHRDAGGQTPLGGALYPLHGLYLRLPAARH